MNRLMLLLLLFACTFQLFAQAPNLIKFQAIARDADNNAITSAIDVRLTVLKGSANGSVIYVDEQTVTPNSRGLFAMNLGASPASGNFANIGWSTADHFLLAEIRQTIGDPYEALGAAQPILSVPYALYGEDADADPQNEIQALSLSRTGELVLSRGGGTVDLNLPTTRIVTIPAGALDFNSTSTIITSEGIGLVWENAFNSSATIVMAKPADYSGGDVTFKLIFRVSTVNSGVVQFFLRPRSYNNQSTFADGASVTENPVSVSPTTGFGRIYEQKITIPANRLVNDWWYIGIQRNSVVANALTDDVNVMGTSLEFGVR
jgi:hypothetical protein